MTVIPGNAAKVNLDYSEPKPEAPKAKPRAKPRARPKPLPLRLNKNLMNYPLARDIRTARLWWKSEKTGRWVVALPREDLIQLILPADAPDEMKHAPSGFDMHLLFLWIALLQYFHKVRWVKGTKQTYFEVSQSELLRLLDLVVRNQNRKMVQASERYWSMVRVQFDGWYEPRAGKQVKILPPPIVAREDKIIIIHPDWVKIALDVWTKYLPTPVDEIDDTGQRPWRQSKLPSGYFTAMPALVPSNAAAQNTVLMTMASIDLTKHESGRSSFARKIGLSSDHRKRRFYSALEEAAAWYKEHDGELAWENKGAKIEFTKKEPKVPKKPKKGEGL